MQANGPGSRISLRLCLFAAVLVILAIVSLTGCSNEPAGGGVEATDYRKIEIRDYEGKKLSSIAEEPENSIRGPQAVDIDSYKLRIDGLVSTPTALGYSEVTSLPATKKVIELNCVEGWTMTYLWEGVALRELLETAGGSDPSAKVLIFHCVDGYTSSLPLDYVLSRNIILGYKMNGVTMPPERGYPFQVVAEDRWGYKWAKWVERIEVSSDLNYLGYWEKRGYDNDATLPGAD